MTITGLRHAAFAALVASVFSAPAIAAAPADAHDPHKLSAAELHTFLPIVCRDAKKGDQGYNCSALPGRGMVNIVEPGQIDLSAIAYGGFTAAGADEAYLTYSGLEPHADNFGGGILLRRVKGAWSPVKWIAGGQMDRCVAIPGPGAQKMLCLGGWFGMGEGDSSVWIKDLSGAARTGKVDSDALLKAQDERQSASPNSDCDDYLTSGNDALLVILNLARSQAPGILATSKIVYAPVADARSACARAVFDKVKTRTQTLRYRLVSGKIVIDPPHKFAEVDY